MGAVAAAIGGAIAGAGVVAGAMAMKSEENRAKVKEVLTDAKDKVENFVEEKREESK